MSEKVLVIREKDERYIQVAESDLKEPWASHLKNYDIDFKDESINNPYEVVLNGSDMKQASKFMCGLLRHFPEEYNLDVDENGWARTTEVVTAMKNKYDWIDANKVFAIVSTDSKGRYEVEGHNIRACYGHSIDKVNIENKTTSVPDFLYHGTARTNMGSINSEGIKSMNRNAVHLSDNKKIAEDVGLRKSDDIVVFAVCTDSLEKEGYDIEKRGNNIYTVDYVPPECINSIVMENA